MGIWEACREAVVPGRQEGELLRMVESQEQVATRSLVDDLAEQDLLERMLERSKPPLPENAVALDYLLATPFRYPPLDYGSRFGSRFEPSIFYGALGLAPALAETAYYRLGFWEGMTRPPPGGRLSTEHTLFCARYASDRGVNLRLPPCEVHTERLTNPKSYRETQQFGGEMRAAGIELFIYQSARDPDGGLNVGLFGPEPFVESAPLWKQAWLCDTREAEVVFYNKTTGTRVFPRRVFLVNGELPTPAE